MEHFKARLRLSDSPREELEACREEKCKALETQKDDSPTFFDAVQYISKGDAEKGTPPFILSKIL